MGRPTLSEHDFGCSDGGCWLNGKYKSGMHTNGGCKCLDRIPLDQQIDIKKALAFRDDKITKFETSEKEFDNAMDTIEFPEKYQGKYAPDIIRAAFKEIEALKSRSCLTCISYLGDNDCGQMIINSGKETPEKSPAIFSCSLWQPLDEVKD